MVLESKVVSRECASSDYYYCNERFILFVSQYNDVSNKNISQKFTTHLAQIALNGGEEGSCFELSLLWLFWYYISQSNVVMGDLLSSLYSSSSLPDF